jgi:hypothetical protein
MGQPLIIKYTRQVHQIRYMYVIPDEHTHYQVDLIRCTCQVYLIASGWPYK